MKIISPHIYQTLHRIPNAVYLWVAVLIFAASNSVTRKIVEIGKYHLVNGRNPISLCNVLFVGNLCAFLVLTLFFYKDWQLNKLKMLSRSDWLYLTIIAILSGAIAPALIFTALEQTNVTNIVLISRLEPPLTLALGVWLLAMRVNTWTVVGSLVCFAGVIATAFFGSSNQMFTMMGVIHLGKGELLVAIAAICSSIATIFGQLKLQGISVGIFSIYRNIIGTSVFFILANYLYGSQHFADAFSPFLWGWMFIYAAVIVVAGQLCWFKGLKKATLTEVTLVNSFNPIAAIIMAYLILGEVPTSAQYLGGSIIIVGIILSLMGSLYQPRMRKQLVYRSSANMMAMMGGFKGL